MGEAHADVKEDSNQLKLPTSRRAEQRRCNPSAQIKRKSLEEKPRSQKPAEIVRQRNAKLRTAVMPYPGLADRRRGSVHHHVPLRHHKRRDDWQSDELEWPIEPPIRTVEQDGRDDPGEVSRAEPQRTDDDRDGADAWKTGVGDEMIVPKGESRRGADVLHRERDRDAKDE